MTWSTDGIIYIDQDSLPSSDIYILFPYLFRAKRPKNLLGFQEFVEKISCMGLGHLIYQKPKTYICPAQVKKAKLSDTSGANWWFLD